MSNDDSPIVRILHFIGTLRAGGAERQLGILAKAQTMIGHEVHIAFGESGVLHSEIANSGVQLHLVAKKGNRDVRMLKSVSAIVDAVEPDVIQTWLPQMDVAAGLISRLKGIPWVMTERSCRAAYSMKSSTDVARRAVGYFAGTIVANSRAGQQMWDGRSISPSTRVIPNALDFNAILRAEAATADAVGFSGPYVLAVGRLTESKNFKLLLDVATEVSRVTNLKFVICGEGPQAQTVRDIIDQRGLSDSVFLFGLRFDVWGLMKSATAFVSTSRFEGHPNAVLEAMVCRTPLVVSDIPAHREFLDSSTAHLVPSRSKSHFARAIMETLSNREAAVARSDAAFLVASEYTPLRAAREYDAAYEEVRSNPR